MSANPDTAAPTGRNKPAQGKERSDAALGHASQNTSSPEGAKQGGELHGSWQRVKLGQIAEVIMGQAPRGDETNFEQRGAVFVKAGEFGPVRPVVREWTTRPLKFAKAGDVLICVVGATCGKLNLSIDCAIGRSVAALRPGERTFDSFLHFQLMPKVLTLRAGSTGSAQGVLSRDVLAGIGLVLPPLPEQRRIVAEIEKQFTRLEAGVAALRRVQANLKRYRAAVLKAACEGRLVPTEAALQSGSGVPPLGSGKKRQDAASTFETGETLLARILTERRQNWQGRGKYKEPAAPKTADLPALPGGWTWANGEQLFSWSSGEGLTQKDIQEGQYPVYGGNGVTGYHNAFVAEIPTLVIGRVGALCGNVYLTDGAAWITDNAIYAIQTPSCVAMRFIRLAFTRAELNKRATGSGQPFVNQRMLNETVIPLPPLAEQTRIVAEVERRLSVVEELESVVTANLQRATRLRQSILQRAFCGKLLSNDCHADKTNP